MKEEYKWYELEVGYPEGFTFDEGKVIGWREEGEHKWHRTENYLREFMRDTYPIRMVVSVTGFTDSRAPNRNWGDE